LPPKVYISQWQAVLLVLLACISTTILFVPGESVSIVKQDAWIAVILGSVFSALFLYYPLADLGSRFPEKTIIEYSENILGKYLGKVFGGLLIYWYFQVHCWTLREFGELSMIILPETPLVVFMIALSLVTVFAVYNGMEVIGRCGEFVFPLGLVSLILVGAAGVTRMNPANLFPVMESSLLPLIRASISPMDWLTTGVVFGVVSAFVRKGEGLKKVGFVAAVMAGGLVTAFSMVNILILGVPVISISNFPLLAVAKQATIPSFERLEILVIFLWITWIFIRTALFSFITVWSIAQWLGIKEFRSLYILETILAVAYSLFQYESLNELFYRFSVAHLFYLTFQLLLPLFLWIVCRLRGLRLPPA
jgi:spore germination protein KB